MEESTLKIYADGGARGNPGPSAAGFVVIKKEKIVHEQSKYLGKGTNNEAEYAAVLIALEWLEENKKKLGGKKISFYLDSELVVRQLTGIYKVRSSNLKPLVKQVKVFEEKIGKEIKYFSIGREKNKLADSLVNKQLDENK